MIHTWVDASYVVHPDMTSRHTGGSLMSLGTGVLYNSKSTKEKTEHEEEVQQKPNLSEQEVMIFHPTKFGQRNF